MSGISTVFWYPYSLDYNVPFPCQVDKTIEKSVEHAMQGGK